MYWKVKFISPLCLSKSVNSIPVICNMSVLINISIYLEPLNNDQTIYHVLCACLLNCIELISRSGQLLLKYIKFTVCRWLLLCISIISLIIISTHILCISSFLVCDFITERNIFMIFFREQYHTS